MPGAAAPGAVPDAAPAIGDAGNFAGSLSFNPAVTAPVASSVLAPAAATPFTPITSSVASSLAAPSTAPAVADVGANLGANATADAAETAVDAPAATGIGASAMMPYGWTLPLASGLHKGVDALFNINEDNTGKVIGDVFDPLKARERFMRHLDLHGYGQTFPRKKDRRSRDEEIENIRQRRIIRVGGILILKTALI